MLLFGGEESAFGQIVDRAWWKVRIEVGELLVEGEGAVEMDRDHADDVTGLDADEVFVAVMKAIDQHAVGIGVMLGDFLDERAVVQAVNLLELPGLGGHFEDEAACAGAGPGEIDIHVLGAGWRW
jgi:hypothetical protein